MNHRINRRGFLRTTGALGAAATMTSLSTSPLSAAEAAKTSSPHAEKIGWRLACELYTFRHISFYEALEPIAALGLRHVEPGFFLRLDKDRPALRTNESLSAELRDEMKEKMATAGVKMSNFYANLQNNEADCRQIFEFAKEMGVENLVAEPPAEAMPMIDGLCQEYEINLAIHNHPKSATSKYWRPENVLKVCQGRSKRIGACCDTGHWVRSGLDPVESLKKMEGRVVSFHLKDVIAWGEPAARDVPLGTGKAKYAAVLTELHRQGFQGVLSIEYEHQSPKLVEEVAQCIAFVENWAKAVG